MPTESSPLVPPIDTKLLAFVLPQFHPIPENDIWWGKGFTEWTNTSKCRPLFLGHYQPHLPADLGYYDLRMPETRELQAELARKAGISAFCYYHYWFHGRRVLERPVNDILESGQPDFPFCLCWANESWSRNWDGHNDNILLDQTYSREDDLEHIAWLIRAFADPRYLKIDGKPLFLIYRPADLPHPQATFELWRRMATEAGFPGLYLCSVLSFPENAQAPALFGLDAAVSFRPNLTDCGKPLKSDNPLDVGYIIHQVKEYNTLVQRSLDSPVPAYPFFPSACPSWDNSARRRAGAVIFRDATPEKFGAWIEEVCYREHFRGQSPSLIFINAWNEWAEGNHLEPCQRWGHAYIEATRAALSSATQRVKSIELRCNDIVRVSSKRHFNGNLEGVVRTQEGAIHVSGWTVWLPLATPPTLLLFAEDLGDDRMRIINRMNQIHISRPDVAEHLRAEEARWSGWSGQLPPQPESTKSPIAILAYDIATHEFAVVASIPL